MFTHIFFRLHIHSFPGLLGWTDFHQMEEGRIPFRKLNTFDSLCIHMVSAYRSPTCWSLLLTYCNNVGPAHSRGPLAAVRWHKVRVGSSTAVKEIACWGPIEKYRFLGRCCKPFILSTRLDMPCHATWSLVINFSHILKGIRIVTVKGVKQYSCRPFSDVCHLNVWTNFKRPWLLNQLIGVIDTQSRATSLDS